MNTATRIVNETRRHFLKQSPLGLAGLALSTMLGDESSADATRPLAERPAHATARAKNVIFLHMAGSPPHLDLFDYKPELVKRTGELCPDEYYEGKRFAFTSSRPTLLGTPRTFRQHGDSGMWLSDAIPELSGMADELCVIRSMYTEQFNHAPAQLMLYTGSPRVGRPSLGSWVTYGLGTENQDLPGFVVLISGGTSPSAGKTAWGSGFLPSVFQGVQCRSQGDPVLFVSDPPGVSRSIRRESLDALNELNQQQFERLRHDETLTRMAQYELAYRMQISVPEVMDIGRENQSMLDAYGAEPGQASFANNCLLARRLVEQGVRFVQLFDWGWDFHGTRPQEDIRDGLTEKCRPTDRAVAALIRDLRQRGLLDETLVVFSGEFGRTPFREGRTAKKDTLGRDHFPDCYSMMLCGGGVRPGTVYGSSDDLGFRPAQDKVHVHDLQATLLHLMGMNHERLTYRYQGRDFRLTDVHGEVIRGILA
ncbi:MAG: sulfatase [Planctomycetaceae bacterium]|nr:sulfatase [Planctomycetaceae bacterium]